LILKIDDLAQYWLGRVLVRYGLYLSGHFDWQIKIHVHTELSYDACKPKQQIQ